MFAALMTDLGPSGAFERRLDAAEGATAPRSIMAGTATAALLETIGVSFPWSGSGPHRSSMKSAIDREIAATSGTAQTPAGIRAPQESRGRVERRERERDHEESARRTQAS